MTTLRDDIIKLAHDNPGQVRDALLPILAKQAAVDPADTLVQMLGKGGGLFKDLEGKTGSIMKMFQDGQRQLEGSKRYTANGDFQVALAHLRKVSTGLKDLSKFADDLHEAIDKQTGQFPRL